MAKNLVWGPILGPWDKFGSSKFFSWILFLLHVRHCCKLSCMQYQGKLMNQTWENCKKTSFRTDFGPFGPNLDLKIFHKFYLDYVVGIIASYHCMYFQEELMNQTWENGKNLVSGSILAKFGPQKFFSQISLLLHSRHCCKLSLYAISRKITEPNLRK